MVSISDRSLVRQEFRGLTDGGGLTIEDVIVDRCTFIGCGLSHDSPPRSRTIVRRVRATRCTTIRSSVGNAVFDDVVVDGLRTHDAQFVLGAVFRHVVLRGRIGRLIIRPEVWLMHPDRRIVGEWVRDAEAFYENVDWALDITEAEFDEVELTGIPPEKIRRDPSTSAIVTREAALAGRWRDVDLFGTSLSVGLEMLAQAPVRAELFVAPRGPRKHSRAVDALQALKDAGIAEPDA